MAKRSPLEIAIDNATGFNQLSPFQQYEAAIGEYSDGLVELDLAARAWAEGEERRRKLGEGLVELETVARAWAETIALLAIVNRLRALEAKTVELDLLMKQPKGKKRNASRHHRKT